MAFNYFHNEFYLKKKKSIQLDEKCLLFLIDEEGYQSCQL